MTLGISAGLPNGQEMAGASPAMPDVTGWYDTPSEPESNSRSGPRGFLPSQE
jgi:hypothetical protein